MVISLDDNAVQAIFTPIFANIRLKC